jgi:hypothetical protein
LWSNASTEWSSDWKKPEKEMTARRRHPVELGETPPAAPPAGVGDRYQARTQARAVAIGVQVHDAVVGRPGGPQMKGFGHGEAP